MSDRIKIFQDTVRVYSTDPNMERAVLASIEGESIIWEEDPLFAENLNKYEKPCSIRISAKRTMEAASPYVKEGKKVCILNFASSMTPGGGVVHGATAQEESLCRISTLYAALTADKAYPFYLKHHQLAGTGEMGRENRDDCIFTPGVICFRKDDFDCAFMEEKDHFAVDVITCAAPDLRSSYRPTWDELRARHLRRADRILDVAAKNGEEVVILGAFGCGAFQNNPMIVQSAYADIVKKYAHAFEVIEFAIPNVHSENYQAFKNIPGIVENHSTRNWYD